MAHLCYYVAAGEACFQVRTKSASMTEMRVHNDMTASNDLHFGRSEWVKPNTKANVLVALKWLHERSDIRVEL